MGHETDGDVPVEAPEDGAAAAARPAAPTGTETKWPTWEDIARLHAIPDRSGAVPAPLPAVEQAPDEPASEAAAVTESEPEVEPEAGRPGDDAAGPGADAEPEAPAGPVVPDDATVVMAPVAEPELEPAESDEPAAPEPEPEEVAGTEPATDEAAATAPEPEAGPEAERPEGAAVGPGVDVEPEVSADPMVPDDATVVMAPVAEPALVAEPAPVDDPTVVMAPAAAVSSDETVILAPVAAHEPETAVPEPEPEPHPAPVPEPDPEPTPPAAPQRVSAFPATSSAPAAGLRVTAGPVPAVEREPSVLDEFAPEGRSHWGRNLAIAFGVLVVLGGAYVGACYAFGDRVPRGATVAGVDIGGLSSSDAVQRLTTELAPETDQPLTVTANDVQAQIDPKAAGLSFDAQATVDSLTGVDPTDPARLWRQVVGVGEVEAVASADTTKLAAALDGLATTLSADPVNGSIVFVDGSPHSTPAADGWQVDQAAAVQQIAATWLTAARPVALPTAAVEPDITQAETDQVLADVAQRVSGGPVSVTVAGQSATLTASTLAANASFVPKDGTLALQMNGQALTDAVLAQVPQALTPASDAHFEFQNDAPVIVPGVPGTTLDPDQVATAVGEAASKPSDRTADLELVETDPAQSTAALEALGVTQVVAEFDTPLTSDHIRDINIKQGAANITGVLVRPGEEFSLTDALGPVDADHGFVEAGAIVSGQHTDAIGGGLSQISTTTYNAAYLAGFEILEHHPHSEYFSRYPEGREATIFTGTLDMRWKNNTPYGALVQAWVSDDHRVHVRIWGTPYWRVESTTSPRTNVKAPTTVYSQSATCEAQSAGNPGFTVVVTRKTYLGDELKNTESWTTTYRPQNQIVCGAAPSETPATG